MDGGRTASKHALISLSTETFHRRIEPGKEAQQNGTQKPRDQLEFIFFSHFSFTCPEICRDPSVAGSSPATGALA
ncbi:hypothetical protein PoB_000924200 [Plakobranchus ocellatus]|uniref:Uncharacterized protein n=1 Tax=Plakobranchus ocellatus TaxID=259542 RepID=A0AAV3YK26_9GAST|nr:hypothetical protein PoB_000924200 [Plakobranchus ocellatus]